MKNANISVKLFALLLISTQEVVKRQSRICSVKGENKLMDPEDLIYPNSKTTITTRNSSNINNRNNNNKIQRKRKKIPSEPRIDMMAFVYAFSEFKHKYIK